MSSEDLFHGMFIMFQHFNTVTENNSLEQFSDEDIESIFKEAFSIEKFCLQLKAKHLSEVFGDKLAEYFKRQNYINFPDFNFFLKASDILLTKFLTDSKLSDSAVKVSIDHYVNHCGENRFSTVIEGLKRTRLAYLELSNFVEASCSPFDIESRFIYESFCKRLNLKTRNSLSIDESVMEMLQADKKSIKILFLILCFKDDCEFSKTIKLCIISKMTLSVSLRNMSIWKCFIELSVEKVKFILISFPEFLNSLFDVINCSSEMFYCNYDDDKIIWLPKSSECLSYSDIVKLLDLLYSIGDPVKNRVKNYFNSRRTTNYCLLFEDIEIEVLKSNSLRK